MTVNNARFNPGWYMLSLRYTKKILSACIFLFFILLPLLSQSQDEPEYDEISVYFNVHRFGGTDLNAVIKDDTVYLPVNEIFNFLKIKNSLSEKLDSITGFFLNQQATYLIDKTGNKIVFQDKTFQLKPDDLIRTEFNLFLKSAYFGQIFGLECAFSFRSLSVAMTTKLELPVIREMRQEQMRSNINRLKGEVKADTTIGRSYPFFSLGMADWSVISTQQIKGKTDARLNFTLGSVIAGGEANVSLNYNKNTPFSEKEQYYLWRFVNNDHKALRQTMAGKISSQTTSSIFNPIVGVQFTNTPTTYRRSFGTYTLSDVTEPNWIVELYVNSVLVDYMKADASGFFKFEVPLVYGNSSVMLRFYGPWGEERTREVNISIPFNFLPSKEFEYSVSAGMVEDTLNSRFSRAVVNYGLTPRMTVGGGMEYLSSVTSGSSMPFVNTSIRLASSLLISGEYTHGVRFKGLLSYRMPSNMQMELNYSKYTKGQSAIIYNYLEERKAVVSMPVKTKNFSAYTRLTFNQIVMQNLKNTNAELLLSGALYGVNTNFTTYGIFTDPSNPYIYSNLSLALRLPSRITFTPQVQYEYLLNEIIAAKANFEKPLFNHGFLNLSYEQNFKSKITSVEVGLRYDLPFAQTGISARQSNDLTSFVQSARGSLIYDPKTNYFGTTNRSSVGKGAITFLPFLDLNRNGHHDADEPKVAGLNLRIDGGRILISERDTTIHVLDLIPYTSYFVELNKNSFDNIAWQISKQTMSVTVDANLFKTIEIPVAVMGEVSGMIYEKKRSENIGMGRVLINFYSKDSTLAGRTMSEADGYFSLLGLAPGDYTARIDPSQLEKINMKSIPFSLPVTVARSKDGDVIDGLEFTLQSTIPVPAAIPVPEKKPVIIAPDRIDLQAMTKTIAVPDSTKVVQEIPDKTKITVISGSPKTVKAPVVDNYKTDSLLSVKPVDKVQIPVTSSGTKLQSGTAIQVGAFINKANATSTLRKLEKVTGRTCVILSEDGFHKVRVIGFTGISESDAYLPKLIAAGFPESFVVVYHEGMVIQVDAFIHEVNALAVQKKLILATGRTVKVVHEGRFYKVRIAGFSGRKAAEAYLPKIVARGYYDAFIIRDSNPSEALP